MSRSPEAIERRRHVTTRHRVCHSKAPFSRQTAQARARRLDTPGDPRGPTRAYRCPFCHRWHVGHLPTIKALERIAAAIRYFAGNGPPPQPPTPPGDHQP